MAGTTIDIVAGQPVVIPPGNRQAGDPGHIGDHNNASGVLMLLASSSLVPTAQTAAYVASLRDLVVADATSGSFAVTVPSAPPDLSCVGVKLKATAAGHTVTVQLSGTDQFTDGTTSRTLATADQYMVFMWSAGLGKWLTTIGATAASSGMSNPMTTLGDLITGGASGAATRLAGDTSNTRKFLRSLSSGGIAGALVWDTITASDLPAATTGAQGAVILDGTSADIQPLGTQAAGSSTKAAAANHVHAMPRLDQISAPTADVAMNSHKLTGLANGVAATDAATVGQLPASGASLTPTAIKTSAYTAAAGDLVLVDSTSGVITITLPTAPADKTLVGVKQEAALTPNTVHVACGGSDQFNNDGSTNTTLQTQNEAGVWQYISATSRWVKISNDLERSALDSRYLQLSGAAMGGFFAPAVVSLTDAATIAVDASLGNVFRVTLGGNRTLGNPTNLTDGEPLWFDITQDATGGRTLTLGANYGVATGLAMPTLSTGAGKIDSLGFRYNAAKGKVLLVGYVLGY